MTTVIPLSTRLECFIKLGKALSSLDSESKSKLASKAKMENPWFTESNVLLALSNLSTMLLEDHLVNFVLNYSSLQDTNEPKNVGVVMAGNIPAVGFHDAMSVLLSGHKLLAKLSKDDKVLMEYLLDKVKEIEPAFSPYIQLVERLSEIDAVICTGSDNSARYFEHYFGKYPHIIRKNRTSVAVLDGSETPQELRLLADDLFMYYGLGCRNVSKLFIPADADITKIIDALEPCSAVIDQNKYANNYTYNRAVLLLNMEPFLDNGFALLKETEAIYSPLSVIHYERYANKGELLSRLKAINDNIQCVVSKIPEIPNKVSFGQSQCPTLMDYADGVDTMQFLTNL